MAIGESQVDPRRERRLGTLWFLYGQRCILYRVQGNLELRLYKGSYVQRQIVVGDLDDAEELATRWLHEGVVGATQREG